LNVGVSQNKLRDSRFRWKGHVLKKEAMFCKLKTYMLQDSTTTTYGKKEEKETNKKMRGLPKPRHDRNATKEERCTRPSILEKDPHRRPYFSVNKPEVLNK